MYKLAISRLIELFSSISGNRELYLPVEVNGQVQFGKWSPESVIRLDKLNTVKSAKDLFFPQSENLVAFKTQGKQISILENRDETKPFAVFGVRACDAASFGILDKVFLAEPVDTYYKIRRDNGVVVTLACSEPEETCFCSAFGIDAVNPAGDVSTWIAGDTLYWNSLTEKGDALTETVEAVFETANSADEEKLESHKAEVKAIMEKLPLHDLSLKGLNGDALNEVFNSPKWEELSQACIGCGTCTFV